MRATRGATPTDSVRQRPVMPPRSPERSPARVSVAEPSFSKIDMDPKRQNSVNDFAAAGGLLGTGALQKQQHNRSLQGVQGADRVKVGNRKRRAESQQTRLKPPERPHSVAGGERTDQLESVLPNMPPKVTRVAKRSARGASSSRGGEMSQRDSSMMSRVQPRDLSPLRDPRGAASLAGSAAGAIAQANPWTEGGSHPYSDQVREQAQKEFKDDRYTPGASVLPDEFRVSEVDPIFPTDMADNHDIEFDESKGGFNTTVFPSKRPVRRSEVGKLRETMEKMLGRMEEEEAAKAKNRELAAIEQDALVSMMGDSDADITAKAQRRVRRETDTKIAVLGKLQSEESVVLIIFDELSRQLAVQSKDRAGLMLLLVEQLSGLFRSSVSVATNDAKLFESQNRRLAEQNERVLKFKRQLEAAIDTIAVRDAKMEGLEDKVRDDKVEIDNLKDELKRVKIQRDVALKQLAGMRELEREKVDLEREARETALMVRNLRGEIEDERLKTKQAKMEHKTEAGVSQDLYKELQSLKKELSEQAIRFEANMQAAGGASSGGASKDDQSLAAPELPVPMVKYDLPPENPQMAKVEAAKKAKAAKELEEMEAAVAAQANKVAMRMGEEGMVTDEHMEDGEGTAAQRMLAGHIEAKGIDVNTSGGDFADVEAGASEESGVAERMARLTLKRLTRRLEDIDKQHKRYAHRLKEIEDKEKKGIVVNVTEKTAMEHAQVRLDADSDHARDEIKGLSKAFKSKSDMGEMMLGWFFPDRVLRLKKRMEETLAEAQEIEDKEIASLKNTMEFGTMDAKTEANVAKNLTDAQLRHAGLLQYHEELQDRLNVTAAETKEIELALMGDFGVMDEAEKEIIAEIQAKDELIEQVEAQKEVLEEEDDKLQQLLGSAGSDDVSIKTRLAAIKKELKVLHALHHQHSQELVGTTTRLDTHKQAQAAAPAAGSPAAPAGATRALPATAGVANVSGVVHSVHGGMKTLAAMMHAAHRPAFESDTNEPDHSEPLITTEAHVVALEEHITELAETFHRCNGILLHPSEEAVMALPAPEAKALSKTLMDQVAELQRLTKPFGHPSPAKAVEIHEHREALSSGQGVVAAPGQPSIAAPAAAPAAAAAAAAATAEVDEAPTPASKKGGKGGKGGSDAGSSKGGKNNNMAIDAGELEELKNDLKEKSLEVRKLTTKIKDLQRNEELQFAQAELESTEKKLRRYKELLVAAEQESLLAQERLMKLMRENGQMVKQIEDAQAAIRSSQEELRLLRMELSQLQGDYEGTLKELATVKAERDELRKDAIYKQMYLDLEQKHIALEKLAAKQAAEILRLTGEVADARKKLQASLEELAAPMAAMVETAVQAEESSLDVADWLLNMMIANAQKIAEMQMEWREKLEAEEDARRAVEKERDEIAERAKNALAEIEDLKAKVNKLSFQLKESLDENTKLTSKCATMEKDLVIVTAERDDLLKRLSNLEADIAALQTDLKDEKARCKAVVEKLAILEMVHEGLQAKFKVAEARIEELEALLKAAEAELKKHGIVGKWKEAALASQLAAMRDLLNKARADAEAQTDDEPEPEGMPFVSIVPEVSIHSFKGMPVEVVVRVANRGDGTLMLSSVYLEDDATWLVTDWSDEIAIEQWQGAAIHPPTRQPLDVDPEEATPPIPGEAQPSFHEIKLRCQSEEIGVQTANMTLTTSDPMQPTVTIPVTFTVVDEPKTIVEEVERPPSRPSSADGGCQARPDSREGGNQTDPMGNDDDELARLRAQLAAMQAEMDVLRAENALLKSQLAAALAELEAVKAKLKELEDSLAKGASDSPDDDMFERLEWERKLRESLAHLVKHTMSRGMQTDSDEHKATALAQRDSMHHVEAGRQLHKPRFLAPLVDDETLAARPVKPLRWLLKLIYSVYEAKFLADAVDNRYGHPHDPFPEFIYMWTCKRYGLRDLVGATRWDLANAVDEYTEHLAEVRMFGTFMFEEYGTEQLGFFLYCRSVVHDHASAGLPKSTSASGMEALLRAVGRYLPVQLTLDVITQVLGHRLPVHAMDALVQSVHNEAMPFQPETADFSAAGGSELLDASVMAAFYEKYGFRRTNAGEEGLLVIEEARFLELLLLAYSTEREAYRVALASAFAEADGDGDGELDKGDFVKLAKIAVSAWTSGQAKDVFWRATAPLGVEVLTFDQIMTLADRYVFFNAHLSLPRFTSEEEVLSASEVEMMMANMANHKAYLDQGFVRKLAGRWTKIAENKGHATASTGTDAGSFHSSSQLVLSDTSGTGPLAKARPHSQWGHNLGSSGRAISPLPMQPSTSFVGPSLGPPSVQQSRSQTPMNGLDESAYVRLDGRRPNTTMSDVKFEESGF